MAGRPGFQVLLFQDIAVIPMLALIPLLALPERTKALNHGDNHGGHGEAGLNLNVVAGLSGWQTALVTLAAVGLVIIIGRYLTGPVFRYVAAARCTNVGLLCAI